MELRKAHLEQLRWYIWEAERIGDYYDPKIHFEKRQEELKEWINKQLMDVS